MTPIVRLFYRKEDMDMVDMVVTVDKRQTERAQINVHLLK